MELCRVPHRAVALSISVRPSVRLSVCLSTTEGHGKLKIGRKEARDTGDP